jgi:predicted component of type VI protein secretion system
MDCGLKVKHDNYHLFDFDHNPTYLKFQSLSQMVSNHYRKDTIIAEMKKCDLRCKNCHYLKTLERDQLGATRESRSVLDVLGHLVQ